MSDKIHNNNNNNKINISAWRKYHKQSLKKDDKISFQDKVFISWVYEEYLQFK